MDVGVVGAGTAGTAAALFLARAGHAVTLYERVPEPGPVGAGIILQPTGQSVLARLGLLEAVAARTARLDALLCQTARGRAVVDLEYATLGPDLFGLGTHRGVLFDALFSAAQREVDVRCGVAGERFVRRRSAQRARVVSLVDERGVEHGAHDLVIVADGARSKLRDALSLPVRARRYPWGALFFLAEDPERHFRGRLFQVVRGNARMLGLLPTGLSPSSDVPITSLYWSLRADDFEIFRRTPLVRWKDEIRTLLDGAGDRAAREHVEPLLAQIDDPSQLLFAAYHDVESFPWSDDGVVVLGDAAHAMSPQLGQGCNLALMDALVLAECVHAFVDRDATRDGIDRALAAYAHRRRAHLAVYTQATRWLTPFFQSDVAMLGELRDVFMPLFGRLPFARRLMTTSMSGTLGGWSGERMALPARVSEVPSLR